MSENLCPNKGEIDEEGNCQNLPRVDWKPETSWIILGQFWYITLKALLVGLTFGFLTGLITKHFRYITKSPIQETFFILVMGLMAYYMGEELKASGVTSLIVCTIMQAQYAWYNLSP